jgi:hypothetical protein
LYSVELLLFTLTSGSRFAMKAASQAPDNQASSHSITVQPGALSWMPEAFWL